MKIQRKWRRAWQWGKSHWAMHRPVIKQAVQQNKRISKSVRLVKMVKQALAPVAASLLLAAMTMPPAYANPAGGQVTSGAGTIAQSGNTMTVTQSTDKMSINWQSFNIGANEKVTFQQPGASSVALNRVIGNDASAIYGQLSANGKVFLINPSGVLFAKGAQVNDGGLVASTLNLSDTDFQAGNYSFTGSGGSVVNQGTITAEGGYVALLGAQTSNQGVIVAKQGTVALGAGSAVTLDMNGDGLLSLAVNQSAVNALAENKNLIQADGGTVIMTARAADSLAGTVVNNSGVIKAQSINTVNGVILLDGGTNGTVAVSGTLDASGKGSGQTGGTIKVLGSNIALNKGTDIDVSGDNGGGTILVGGNYQGSGNEQHAVATTVAEGAKLNADAITSGNGGKVVVWADNATRFNGTITAKGGSMSGDGGSVEVSGKKKLFYQGHTDTTAATGKTGNLLLDPGEYTISTGATGGNVKNNAELAVELASNNIELKTDGTGTGDITIAAPVSWTADTTLTLSANNNIYVNANITASGNTAGLVLAYGATAWAAMQRSPYRGPVPP